ncbi:DUF3592 domain-containing protein [Streptomyces sp. NPDC094049]|uniref:DUF3592 domain-containing protein n=1 Tax=Streptomyces sp. NPDC094049 TaxID=3154987 RepID=UPI00332F90A6
MGRNTEMVLKGRGGAFRLEDGRVRVVRGRTTWDVPLAAIAGVDHGDGPSVRLRISGAEPAREFSVSSGNRAAVSAFTRELERVTAGVVPVSDGGALVTASVRPRTLPRPSRRTVVILGCLALVALLLTVAESAGHRALVVVGSLLTAMGGGMLALTWILLARDRLVLRRRGITVPGEIVRYRTTVKDQTQTPVYRFTTLEGVERTQESSVFLYWRRSDPRVDVVYDPQDPTVVRGGPAAGHLIIGVLMGTLGAALTLGGLTMLGVVVAGALPGN